MCNINPSASASNPSKSNMSGIQKSSTCFTEARSFKLQRRKPGSVATPKLNDWIIPLYVYTIIYIIWLYICMIIYTYIYVYCMHAKNYTQLTCMYRLQLIVFHAAIILLNSSYFFSHNTSPFGIHMVQWVDSISCVPCMHISILILPRIVAT